MFTTGSIVIFLLVFVLFGSHLLFLYRDTTEAACFSFLATLAMLGCIVSASLWFWPTPEIFHLTFPIASAAILLGIAFAVITFKKKQPFLIGCSTIVLIVSMLVGCYTQLAIFSF